VPSLWQPYKPGSNLTPVTHKGFSEWVGARLDKKKAELEAVRKGKGDGGGSGRGWDPEDLRCEINEARERAEGEWRLWLTVERTAVDD
jgi:hypothetical protein